MCKNKILLIGGNGFIGKNIVKYIRDNKMDNDSSLIVLSKNCKNTQYNNSSIQYVSGSYADIQFLDDLFKREGFTHVFHLASTTVPASSNQNIEADIHDNLLATISLLEIMKQNSCDFLLYLSSGGAVYGEFQDELLKETHYCQPISSYGILKFTIEQYIRLYHRQAGLKYLILRLSNPYGPFHTSEQQGVINIALRKAIKRKSFEVWGNGKQAKDYIYVEDVARIVWKLIDMQIINEIFNVGSGETTELNVILQNIKSFVPGFTPLYKESKISDVSKFCLDISKLNNLFDCNLTPIDVGLIKTFNWETEVANA